MRIRIIGLLAAVVLSVVLMPAPASADPPLLYQADSSSLGDNDVVKLAAYYHRDPDGNGWVVGPSQQWTMDGDFEGTCADNVTWKVVNRNFDTVRMLDNSPVTGSGGECHRTYAHNVTVNTRCFGISLTAHYKRDNDPDITTTLTIWDCHPA